MGVGSVVIGIAAFLFMFGGFIFSPVPFLGGFLAFGAPVLALAGCVMGGIGLSRAKRDGLPTGAPMAGLIINIVAFIPAVVIALTCGLCNACITEQSVSPRDPGRRGAVTFYDAGVLDRLPDPPLDPGAAPAPIVEPPLEPGAPPPAVPPPPLPGADEREAPEPTGGRVEPPPPG